MENEENKEVEETTEDGQEVVVEQVEETKDDTIIEEPLETIEPLNSTINSDNTIDPELVELGELANSLDEEVEETNDTVEEKKEDDWDYPEQKWA